VALLKAVPRVNHSPEVEGGSASGHCGYDTMSESVSEIGGACGFGHGSHNTMSEFVSHSEGGNFESGESSQAGGDHYSGEVDGDEGGEQMQNLMAQEDMDGSADELSSDDSDEELPIPGSWNQDFSNAMTVQDGHESHWEYHQNNIAVGGMYPSKKHLKEAIINWAMNTQRVFRTTVSSQKKIDYDM